MGETSNWVKTCDSQTGNPNVPLQLAGEKIVHFWDEYRKFSYEIENIWQQILAYFVEYLILSKVDDK